MTAIFLRDALNLSTDNKLRTISKAPNSEVSGLFMLSSNESVLSVSDTFSADIDRLKRLSVRKFETDSRKVQPGDIFICRQGLVENSHDYIEAAISQGAAGIITTQDLTSPTTIPNIKTPDFSISVDLVSQFYNTPQKQLFQIGITGTNGKTTVAYSLQQLLNQHTPAAYTGTLGCQFGDQHASLVNTTPDAITLLNLMHQMRKQRITHHVMEVSSHALDQNRVSMIDFDMIIFTNLGQDHLDYHGNRDAYLASKLRLADHLKPGGIAIINEDDPVAPVIIERCSNAQIITFSCHKKSADYFASDIVSTHQSGRFTLHAHGQVESIATPLPFRFNIENSLAILAALNSVHNDLPYSAKLLAALPPVPGRSEVMNLTNGTMAIVDYAHNAHGLSALLASTRKNCSGKIHLVIGVTGERLHDAAAIGTLCSQLADAVYFTTHNPLGKDPLEIAQTLLSQADHSRCQIILDRKQAIVSVLNTLMPGDTLLVCGKGNESYQYLSKDKNNRESYCGDITAIREASMTHTTTLL